MDIDIGIRHPVAETAVVNGRSLSLEGHFAPARSMVTAVDVVGRIRFIGLHLRIGKVGIVAGTEADRTGWIIEFPAKFTEVFRQDDTGSGDGFRHLHDRETCRRRFDHIGVEAMGRILHPEPVTG